MCMNTNINTTTSTNEEKQLQRLRGKESVFIRIPSSIISNNKCPYELPHERVALFTYLYVKAGLDDSLKLSHDDLHKYIHKKVNPNRVKNCCTVNIEFLLDYYKSQGYINYNGRIKKQMPTDCTINRDKIDDEADNGNFAIVYLDEIEKILNYPLDGKKYGNDALLLLFAYLRLRIYNRSTAKGSIDQKSETYDDYYKSIGEVLNIPERIISSLVDILVELNLIYVFTRERKRIVLGEHEYKFRTLTSIFTNTYKRNKGYLLNSGEQYYKYEVELKIKEEEIKWVNKVLNE